MKKPKQVSAGIDPVRARKLKIRLAHEGCSFRAWLEDRIDEYLSSQNNQENSPIGGSENE